MYKAGLVVLGGILIGDTFRLTDYIKKCKEECDELYAVCDTYNTEVLDMFKNHSDVPIINYITRPRYSQCASWVDFVNFEAHKETRGLYNKYDIIFIPSATTLGCPLPAFMFNGDFDIALPPEFIVTQPATCHTWKNREPLFSVSFPLPLISVGKSGERVQISNARIEQNRPIKEIAYIISKAKLMVGVDSGISQMAAQIGTPTIKCHFGSWEWKCRNVRDCGGADLLNPSTQAIEECIAKALEIINSGGKDITALTQGE